MDRAITLILALLVTLPLVMTKGRVSEVTSTPTAFSAVSSNRITVRVSGDVRHPGIFEVSAKSMTENVIKLAQSPGAPECILSPEARSAPLVNGADISVRILAGNHCSISVSSIPSGERMVLGIPLDINAMQESDFDRLPGIGPAMAQRIIEYRQKNGGTLKVGDLRAVEGIGEVTYRKLAKYF